MNTIAVPTIHVADLKGHTAPILNARFNSSGRYLLSCGQDRSIILWNPWDGVHIKQYKGPHNKEINDVAIYPDDGRFISVGGDTCAFTWDVKEGRILRKFTGHLGPIYCCATGPHAETFLTGSADQTLRCWDLRSSRREPIEIMRGYTDAITDIKTHEHSIIASSLDGSIREYDFRFGLCHDIRVGDPISSFDMSKDKKYFLVSVLCDSVVLIAKETAKRLGGYGGHKCRQYRLQVGFTPNNDGFFAGSENGVACFWELNVDYEGEIIPAIHCLAGHQGVVFGCRYHPNDKFQLISYGADGVLKTWKVGVPSAKSERRA